MRIFPDNDQKLMIMDKPKSAQQLLESLHGHTVTIWAGLSESKFEFKASISIIGELERHSEKSHQFRVLVNESTYAYFSSADVEQIITTPVGLPNSTMAVIKLKWY